MSLALQAQEDSTVEWNEAKLTKYFKSLDLKQWEDVSVDSFMRTMIPTFTALEVSSSKTLEHKGVVILHYSAEVSVHLYVTEFIYVNPNGMCRKRNLRRLKREKIAAIQVHNELACLEGCN
jgi:hypothetical protein